MYSNVPASTSLSFEEFWELAERVKAQNNALTYHPCCDVWTTRRAVAVKASHVTTLNWKNFVSTLSKSARDKKQAFHAKIIEENMQIPIQINQICKLNINPPPRPKKTGVPRPRPILRDFIYSGMIPPHLIHHYQYPMNLQPQHPPGPTLAENGYQPPNNDTLSENTFTLPPRSDININEYLFLIEV